MIPSTQTRPEIRGEVSSLYNSTPPFWLLLLWLVGRWINLAFAGWHIYRATTALEDTILLLLCFFSGILCLHALGWMVGIVPDLTIALPFIPSSTLSSIPRATPPPPDFIFWMEGWV